MEQFFRFVTSLLNGSVDHKSVGEVHRLEHLLKLQTTNETE